MNQNRKDTSMSQPERPPQPTYLRRVEPVDPVDPQLPIAQDVLTELVTEGRWTAPEVDPESPGVTRNDLLDVLATRVTGPDFAPSGAMVLYAEPTGDGVALRVVTWGPASEGREYRETRCHLRLEELP